MIFRSFLLVIACFFSVACSPTHAPASKYSSAAYNIYIVRHAEKEVATGSDPDLSEQGKRRAALLRDLLKNKNIKAVFTTHTARARNTAEPLSRVINVPIRFYGPLPDDAFVQQVRNGHVNTLIVGHSNTVPTLVNKLSGGEVRIADLGEDEYDRLFIVRFQKDKVSVEQTTY